MGRSGAAALRRGGGAARHRPRGRRLLVRLRALLRELTPENRRLLRRREDLQARIDERNEALAGRVPDPAEEEEFLREIGYLVDPPAALRDRHRECRSRRSPQIAGPQLVVPVSNARYALNAANARWGSLYDALYGTDALGDPPAAGGYDRRARRAGDRLGPRLPRRDRAADRRQPCRRHLATGSRTAGSSPTAAALARSVAARRLARRRRSCFATTISTSRSSIDRDHPIGRDRQGRGRRHPARKRGHRDHGLRGQRRRGRRRGEDRASTATGSG